MVLDTQIHNFVKTHQTVQILGAPLCVNFASIKLVISLLDLAPIYDSSLNLSLWWWLKNDDLSTPTFTPCSPLGTWPAAQEGSRLIWVSVPVGSVGMLWVWLRKEKCGMNEQKVEVGSREWALEFYFYIKSGKGRI